MGNVMATFMIMPDSPDTDLEKIKSEIKKLGPQTIDEQPIAFGLKALKFVVIVPDAEGGTEKIEAALKKIEGVAGVEITEISRTLF